MRKHLTNTSLKVSKSTGYQWLPPIIPATQEAEIRRSAVQSQPGEIVWETLSQKNHHKKEMVEWLKVKVLSSSFITAKKKKVKAKKNVLRS
jgi:hypothetical protein